MIFNNENLLHNVMPKHLLKQLLFFKITNSNLIIIYRVS